jgi:hypothetical protein
LQHKLKKNWTKEESLLYEKLLFLDEKEHKGSATTIDIDSQDDMVKE